MRDRVRDTVGAGRGGDLPDVAVRTATVAQLRAAGVRDTEIRASPLWRRPSRGLRTWAALDPTDAEVRLQEAAAALPPGGALADWSAAVALGCHGVVPQHLRVHAVVPPRTWPPRRPDLQVRRERLDGTDVVRAAGLPVTAPARTWYDAARLLPLPWALAVADAVAGRCRLGREELSAYVGARPRWRGRPQALQVLALCDPRAASAAESRARELWVVAAGLPPPEVNVPVLDPHGRLVAVVDLLDVDAGLVGEVDGGHHRHPAQHRADNRREEQLERLGLVVSRVDPSEVDRERVLVTARWRAAHAEATARNPPATWPARRWWVPPRELRYRWASQPAGGHRTP